jgi:hypothetical protein
MKQVLKVFAAQDHDALITNIDALNSKPIQRRFVGWIYNADVGEAGGWERKLEPETIPYHNDYVKAIKAGDLIPADEKTAQLCGIPWTNKKSSKG